MRSSDFVVIGHLTCDERPGGRHVLGGTATYAAITARNLGYRVGILTRAANDFPQPELLANIELERLHSSTTTTFRNIYQDDQRQQFIRNRAGSLEAKDLPSAWRDAKIVLLGPVAGEIATPVARAFDSKTLLGVTAQGWLRQWDETGRVHTRTWAEAAELLPHARVLILSEQDLGEFTERLQAYITLTRVVVLTRGARGCTVFQRARMPFDAPAFRTNEVDPTGAGDVFAAAFLIRLHETNDTQEAARFANCAASFAIAAVGTTGIPMRDQIEKRLVDG